MPNFREKQKVGGVKKKEEKKENKKSVMLTHATARGVGKNQQQQKSFV